jgi:hypothetical protein
MHKNLLKNFVDIKVRILPKSILSVINQIKKPVIDFLANEKSLTGICATYTKADWKILSRFFSGEFESIFTPKKSTERHSCFSQDLCPQMALHSRLWA